MKKICSTPPHTSRDIRSSTRFSNATQTGRDMQSSTRFSNAMQTSRDMRSSSRFSNAMQTSRDLRSSSSFSTQRQTGLLQPQISDSVPIPTSHTLPARTFCTKNIMPALAKFCKKGDKTKGTQSTVDKFSVSKDAQSIIEDQLNDLLYAPPEQKAKRIQQLNITCFGHIDGPYSENPFIEGNHNIPSKVGEATGRKIDQEKDEPFPGFFTLDETNRRTIGLMVHALIAAEHVMLNSTSNLLVPWAKQFMFLISSWPSNVKYSEIVQRHLKQLEFFKNNDHLPNQDYLALNVLNGFIKKLPEKFLKIYIKYLEFAVNNACRNRLSKYDLIDEPWINKYPRYSCEAVEVALIHLSKEKTNVDIPKGSFLERALAALRSVENVKVLDIYSVENLITPFHVVVKGFSILRENHIINPKIWTDKFNIVCIDTLQRFEPAEIKLYTLRYYLDPKHHISNDLYVKNIKTCLSDLCKNFGIEYVYELLLMDGNKVLVKAARNLAEFGTKLNSIEEILDNLFDLKSRPDIIPNLINLGAIFLHSTQYYKRVWDAIKLIDDKKTAKEFISYINQHQTNFSDDLTPEQKQTLNNMIITLKAIILDVETDLTDIAITLRYHELNKHKSEPSNDANTLETLVQNFETICLKSPKKSDFQTIFSMALKLKIIQNFLKSSVANECLYSIGRRASMLTKKQFNSLLEACENNPTLIKNMDWWDLSKTNKSTMEKKLKSLQKNETHRA